MRLTRIGALAGCLALQACEGPPESDGSRPLRPEPTVEEPPPTAGTVGQEPADKPVEPPWGLDRRPSNPGCLAPARPLPLPVRFVRQFADVALQGETTTLVQRPDDPDWWYVTEKEGRVRRFSTSAAPRVVEELLDIQNKVEPGRELGLLGLAFHPRFEENGQVFLTYTTTVPGPDLDLVLVRFTSTDGGHTLDPASETEILRVTKPYENHHAGNVDFGPDGYLYLGIGDGGGFGDPEQRAQNLRSLFGKILRIDPDHPTGPLPYGIPADNPFVGQQARPEIWALGFRNPWRWSFDPVTGDLWLGDVGRDTIEEIDLVTRGGNYGWSFKEGPKCNRPETDCDPGGLTEPVVSYTREAGNVVVGGHVYRGAQVPELQGQFLFNDHSGDTVYRVLDDGNGGHRMEAVAYGTDDLVDWAYGADGETYTLGLDGTIWRLERAGLDPRPPISPTLSGTGCVDPSDPTRMADALIPFEPAQPFWSDGLDKGRWMALPDGATVRVNPEGDLDFPVGTVLLKEFAHDGVRIETRMLAHHEDGWGGYTYRWREDQSDADLLEAGAEVELDGFTWSIPTRGECNWCHTKPAGFTLGPEVRQLDFSIPYPETGRVKNQIDTLAHLGILPAAVPHPGPYPAKDGPEPVEERARAWLHVNCSGCHQNAGPTPVDLVLLEWTPLAETGLCDPPQQDDFGISDARILTPGDPAASVVSHRIHLLGPGQMPPLGRATVDEVGAALIDEWITSLASCP